MSEDTRPPPQDDAEGCENIEIDFQPAAPDEEGEDGPLPPIEPPDEDTLVIEAEDLLDVDDLPPAGAAFPQQYPAVDYSGVPAGVTKKGKGALFPAGLVGSMPWQTAVAGGLGGVLAWAVIEPGLRAGEIHGLPIGPSPLAVMIHVALFGAALGGFIGFALGAVEGVVVGAWSRAATGGGLGLLIGGAGGAIGGVIGQFAFSMILGGAGSDLAPTSIIQRLLARSLGWALIGAFVGLGPGLMMMAPRKAINGLIGGVIGGFAGGMLFDPVGIIFSALGGAAGTPSRFVGIVLLGIALGLSIGLVEEMRKEAWLIIVAGPLAGKQFIIYKPATWIGSAPAMDIPLLKDQAVGPKHCVLEIAGAAHMLRDLTGGHTLVNGRPVIQHRLADGDVIHIGATGLQYHTRPFAAGPMHR